MTIYDLKTSIDSYFSDTEGAFYTRPVVEQIEGQEQLQPPCGREYLTENNGLYYNISQVITLIHNITIKATKDSSEDEYDINYSILKGLYSSLKTNGYLKIAEYKCTIEHKDYLKTWYDTLADLLVALNLGEIFVTNTLLNVSGILSILLYYENLYSSYSPTLVENETKYDLFWGLNYNSFVSAVSDIEKREMYADIISLMNFLYTDLDNVFVYYNSISSYESSLSEFILPKLDMYIAIRNMLENYIEEDDEDLSDSEKENNEMYNEAYTEAENSYNASKEELSNNEKYYKNVLTNYGTSYNIVAYGIYEDVIMLLENGITLDKITRSNTDSGYVIEPVYGNDIIKLSENANFYYAPYLYTMNVLKLKQNTYIGGIQKLKDVYVSFKFIMDGLNTSINLLYNKLKGEDDE